MFEKCELATCTPRDSKIRDDICTSQTLEEDFNEFAKTVRKEHPYYTPNPELDTLVSLILNFTKNYDFSKSSYSNYYFLDDSSHSSFKISFIRIRKSKFFNFYFSIN